MAKKPNSERTPIYNKGEIVYLVTGGPSMSISEVQRSFSTDEFKGTYRCQWFAGKKLEHGDFPEESLTKTNPNPKP